MSQKLQPSARPACQAQLYHLHKARQFTATREDVLGDQMGMNRYREPDQYSVLQPGGESADSWILVLEVPGTGPDYHVGTFNSRIRALEFAADFDEYVSSAQHWCLIGTYQNPHLNTVMSNIDTEQLR